jgi:hypothetical protein
MECQATSNQNHGHQRKPLGHAAHTTAARRVGRRRKRRFHERIGFLVANVDAKRHIPATTDRTAE